MRETPRLKLMVVLTTIAWETFTAVTTSAHNGDHAKQEIRVWLASPDRGIDAGVREWQRRNPGFVVTTSTYLNGQDPQKLMTSIAGGNPPQLIVQDRSMVGEWAIKNATFFNMLMAASALMTLPAIALFLGAQRYFIEGVTLTGMKS